MERAEKGKQGNLVDVHEFTDDDELWTVGVNVAALVEEVVDSLLSVEDDHWFAESLGVDDVTCCGELVRRRRRRERTCRIDFSIL
jgi:hypothetical protein